MRPGIRVQNFGPLGLRELLQVSSGARRHRIGQDSSEEGGYFPTQDWRSASVEEAELLMADQPLPLRQTISVVSVAPEVRRFFWDTLAARVLSKNAISPEDRSACLSELSQLVVDSLASYSGIQASTVTTCNVNVNRPGTDSTSFDYQRGRVIGLHIDNHDKLSVEARRSGFQLFCMNLGFADRYFQFVNLEVVDLLAMVGTDLGNKDLLSPPSRLTSRFFDEYPNYPITRIRVQPDQAYIAVTQNIIHDGATPPGRDPDVTLLIGAAYEQV